MVTTTKTGKAYRLKNIKRKQAKVLARVTGISRKEALQIVRDREFVAKTDELSLYEAQYREEEVTTSDSSSPSSDKGSVTSSKTEAGLFTTQQPTVADQDTNFTEVGGSSANHPAVPAETDDPDMSIEGPNDDATIDPEVSSEAEDGEESENQEDGDDDVEYYVGSDGQEYYTGPDGLPVPKAWGKVISCYQTFLNPAELIEDDIMILNFPNRGRHQPYNEESGQKPLEVRLKRKAGLMEIDVPIVTHKNYDKDKGELYAEAIRQSAVLREGGSYGMAGGFGVGGGGGRSRRVENEDADADADADADELGSDDEGELNEDDAGEEEENEEMPDVDASEIRGPILDRITLSGKIERPKPYDPHYFIGTFRGDELHLTRVHAFVTLRPTLSHLDATDELQRRQLRSIREDYDQPEPEARAVNMTAQSADEEEMDMSDVSKSLRAIQEEPWVVGSWVDENDKEAFIAYGKSLFYYGDYHKGKNPLVAACTKEELANAIFNMPSRNPKKDYRWVEVDEDGYLVGDDDDEDDYGGETDEEDAEEGDGEGDGEKSGESSAGEEEDGSEVGSGEDDEGEGGHSGEDKMDHDTAGDA